MNKENIYKIKKIVTSRIEVEQKNLENIKEFNLSIDKINELLKTSETDKNALLMADSEYLYSLMDTIYKKDAIFYNKLYEQAKYLEENVDIMLNTTQYNSSKRFLTDLYLDFRKYYIDLTLSQFKRRDEEKDSLSVIWSASEIMSSLGENNFTSLIKNVDDFNSLIEYDSMHDDEKVELLKFAFEEQLKFYKKYRVKTPNKIITKEEEPIKYTLDNPEFVGPVLPYDEPVYGDLEIEGLDNVNYLTEEQSNILYDMKSLLDKNSSVLEKDDIISNKIKSVKDIINDSDDEALKIIDTAKELFGVNSYLNDLLLYQIRDCYSWINECLEEIPNSSEDEKREYIEEINKAFEDYKIYLSEFKKTNKEIIIEEVEITEKVNNKNNLVFLPTIAHGENICFENDMKVLSKNKGLFPYIIKLLDDLKDGNFHLDDPTKGMPLGIADTSLKGFYEIKFKKAGELPAFRIAYQMASNNNIIVYGIFLRKDDPPACVKKRQANGTITNTLKRYKAFLRDNPEAAEVILAESKVAEERIFEKLGAYDHASSRGR